LWFFVKQKSVLRKKYKQTQSVCRGQKFNIVTFCDCHKCHTWSVTGTKILSVEVWNLDRNGSDSFLKDKSKQRPGCSLSRSTVQPLPQMLKMTKRKSGDQRMFSRHNQRQENRRAATMSSTEQSVSDSLSRVEPQLQRNLSHLTHEYVTCSGFLWYSKVDWARFRKLLYSSWDVKWRRIKRWTDISKDKPDPHSWHSV